MHWRLSRWERIARSKISEWYVTKPVLLSLPSPVVTFSFDDFPGSACDNGAKVLLEYGARATYYVSMSYLSNRSSIGQYFSENDLVKLDVAGHELGCHTFDHLDCWRTSGQKLCANIDTNLQAIRRVLPGYTFKSFAYPYGHVSLSAKRCVGQRFFAARGAVAKINMGIVDLNALGAYSLFASRFDVRREKSLLEETARQKGWLIYCSHDVEKKPSPYGCTPDQLKTVVDFASRLGILILPLWQGIEICGTRSCKEEGADK